MKVDGITSRHTRKHRPTKSKYTVYFAIDEKGYDDKGNILHPHVPVEKEDVDKCWENITECDSNIDDDDDFEDANGFSPIDLDGCSAIEKNVFVACSPNHDVDLGTDTYENSMHKNSGAATRAGCDEV